MTTPEPGSQRSIDLPYEERYSDAELVSIVEQGLIYMCACPAQVAEALAPMGAIPLPLIPGAGAPHGDWPAIGGDGTQVLRAAGLSEPEIDALVAAGTVVLPPSPARDTARH